MITTVSPLASTLVTLVIEGNQLFAILFLTNRHWLSFIPAFSFIIELAYKDNSLSRYLSTNLGTSHPVTSIQAENVTLRLQLPPLQCAILIARDLQVIK